VTCARPVRHLSRRAALSKRCWSVTVGGMADAMAHDMVGDITSDMVGDIADDTAARWPDVNPPVRGSPGCPRQVDIFFLRAEGAPISHALSAVTVLATAITVRLPMPPRAPTTQRPCDQKGPEMPDQSTRTAAYAATGECAWCGTEHVAYEVTFDTDEGRAADVFCAACAWDPEPWSVLRIVDRVALT
jgi:hypothetical protein